MRAFRIGSLAAIALVAACWGEEFVTPDDTNNDPGTPLASLAAVTLSSPNSTVFLVGTSVQLVAGAVNQDGGPFSGATLSWSSSNNAVVSVSQAGRVSANAVGSAMITVTATSGNTVVSTSLPVSVSADTPVLAGMTVSPVLATVDLGSSLQMLASPRSQYGGTLDVPVTWSSSNPAVLEIIPATGVVSAITVGSATITGTATFNGITVSASAQLTATVASVLAAVIITPPSPVSLIIGNSVQLTASARDGNNGTIQAQIEWFTADPTVATITNTGLVRSVKVGDVYVGATARAGNFELTSNVLIHITPPLPTSVSVTATFDSTFTPQTVEIARGGTVSWGFVAPNNVTFVPTPGAPANIPTSVGGPISRTFNTAGTFNYSSTIHQGMTGTVIVR